MARDRYYYTKKSETELERYSIARMPRFPVKSTDLYVFSREDDRLDNLAYEFYEDPRYWWVIAEANNLGKGTFAIPPGLQIRIPLPIDDLLSKLKTAEETK